MLEFVYVRDAGRKGNKITDILITGPDNWKGPYLIYSQSKAQ